MEVGIGLPTMIPGGIVVSEATLSGVLTEPMRFQSLVRSIVPPIISQSCFAMLRPSPVPP